MQIKSNCLISLLVIILLKVKIKHAFKFTVLCAIQFQLMVFMQRQPGIMLSKWSIRNFSLKNGPWAKKVENH